MRRQFLLNTRKHVFHIRGRMREDCNTDQIPRRFRKWVAEVPTLPADYRPCGHCFQAGGQ